jgi:hypothetical protein
MPHRLLLALPLLGLMAGCTTLCGCSEDKSVSVIAPDPPAPPPAVHVIDFHVTGTDPGTVEITLTSSTEGTSTIRTNLPWFSTLKTTRTSSFLSLQAKDRDFFSGTITVQIFVDGLLFREASVTGFNPVAAIDGTWTN